MKLMKNAKEKAFVALTLMMVALPASANTATIDQIGQMMAEQIGKFAIVIGAMGMAGIGVVVLATAFKMAFSFVKSLR